MMHGVMSDLRILIDEGYTTVGKLTGIGFQGLNLFKHLLNLIDVKITNYWYLKYIPKVIRKFTYIALSNVRSLFLNYDIIHYQNFYVPLFSGKSKKVVTIHDLGVFRFPETVPFIYVKYNQLSIKNAVRRADIIVTPSLSIKNEIIEMFPDTDSNKIAACQNGIRKVFFEHKPNMKTLSEFNLLPHSYFFFIGSLTRRKNITFLLESFIEAKRIGKINESTKLLLIGNMWWGAGDFKELIKQEYGIQNLGYLPDETVIDICAFSKGMIFPSIYEGFGMPIIEAMSLNIPIIASNIPTSIELNNDHNKQMLIFELGNKQSLLEKINLLEKNYNEIVGTLDYGDISIYKFDKVAERAIEIYKMIQIKDEEKI